MPNFFWDSEPTLHPLYVAIRDYLEIDPRIKVLNERCRVFLDLADILADSVADAKMSSITWIIIILIIISIIVTVSEVGLRFSMLSRSKGGGSGGVGRLTRWRGKGNGDGDGMVDLRWLAAEAGNVSLEELRSWAARLGEREREAVCGSELVGRTFAGV